MQSERVHENKFTVTKRNNPKITKAIRAITWTNGTTVSLSVDGEMRMFKKFTDPHILYYLKEPYRSFQSILGMHPSDCIALFNTRGSSAVGVLNVVNFETFQLTGFNEVFSVSYEPKCLVIVDKNGVHIYYVAQGFTKISIIKFGLIKLSLLTASRAIDASIRFYLTKQSFGMLYLMKFLSQNISNHFKYSIKLFTISKHSKGYHAKASLTLPSPAIDIVPLEFCGLVAVLTANRSLFLFHVESQTLVSEPFGANVFKPYKITAIKSGELVAFEGKRVVVIDFINGWRIAHEGKFDQDGGENMVSGCASSSDGVIIFNEGTKFCELKVNSLGE